MKLRNVLVSILSLVLVAVIAVSGTVAYLQDDDSDVNVMTVGNVKIDQIEQERDENGQLVDFTQAKPALPAVGEQKYNDVKLNINGYDCSVLGDYLNNVVDKIVSVKNTGKTEAYIRTIVAIEDPEGAYADMFHVNQFTGNGTVSTQSGWQTIVVNGVRYAMNVYTYNEALAPKEVSAPSLLQVFLDPATTNEDVAKFGDTWDILVISQAVQAAGFADAQTALDTAFGKPSEKAAEWFGGLVIPVYGEDADAVDYVVDNGGKLFVENDITTDQITVDKNTAVEIDLQENTLGGTIENNGELNIYDGALEATYIQNTGTANFTDVEIDAGSAEHYALITKNDGAVTVYKDVDVTTYGGGIAVADGAEAIFESGKVYVTTKSTSGRYVFYLEGAGSELTINGGEFGWNSSLNQKRAYVYADAGTTVTINGGTFGPASTRSGYTAGIMGTGTVIIKGGTFGFDPSAWVADGYEAVLNGSTWTVSEK